MQNRCVLISLSLLGLGGLCFAAQTTPQGDANVQANSHAMARQEALNELMKSQGELAKAIKTLVEAQEELLKAKTDDQKSQANEQVAEAKKQLETAQSAVNERMKDAELAGGRRLHVQGTDIIPPFALVDEARKTDDPTERFILFPPGGPLVVEASITIDGKPFRMFRAGIIDDMLTEADKNADGKTTWQEALALRRFGFGRLRELGELQLEQYRRTYDSDRNDQVDHAEAWRFFNQMSQSRAFEISLDRSAQSMSLDLLPLLDRNQDQNLSSREMSEARDQLKRLDADDNDLLTSQEIASGLIAIQRKTEANLRSPQMGLSPVLGLNPTTTPRHIFQSLKLHYQDTQGNLTTQGFRSNPRVFEVLDADKNGQLDQHEVVKLKEIPAHIELAVESGKEGTSVKVTMAPKEFQVGKPSERDIQLERPGLKLSCAIRPTEAKTTYFARIAENYFKRFDQDKSGELDSSEMAGNYARLFGMWDANEDAKVTPKEIIETYELMSVGQNTQVRLGVVQSSNSLFQSLDQNRDGRLSLREMHGSEAILKSFDKNENSQVEAAEVPLLFGLSFALGTDYTSNGQPEVSPQASAPQKSDAPDWFARMDRNGDGDLSPKEFLGEKQQFQDLDTNNDGFIEPKEAKAAEK